MFSAMDVELPEGCHVYDLTDQDAFEVSSYSYTEEDGRVIVQFDED